MLKTRPLLKTISLLGFILTVLPFSVYAVSSVFGGAEVAYSGGSAQDRILLTPSYSLHLYSTRTFDLGRDLRTSGYEKCILSVNSPVYSNRGSYKRGGSFSVASSKFSNEQHRHGAGWDIKVTGAHRKEKRIIRVNSYALRDKGARSNRLYAGQYERAVKTPRISRNRICTGTSLVDEGEVEHHSRYSIFRSGTREVLSGKSIPLVPGYPQHKCNIYFEETSLRRFFIDPDPAGGWKVTARHRAWYSWSNDHIPPDSFNQDASKDIEGIKVLYRVNCIDLN